LGLVTLGVVVTGFEVKRSSIDIEAQVPTGAPPVTPIVAVLPSVKVTVGQDVAPVVSRQPALEAAANEIENPAGLQDGDTEIPVTLQPAVTTAEPEQDEPSSVTIWSKTGSLTAKRMVPDTGMLKVVELY
jgi:hypothetical protein